MGFHFHKARVLLNSQVVLMLRMGVLANYYQSIAIHSYCRRSASHEYFTTGEDDFELPYFSVTRQAIGANGVTSRLTSWLTTAPICHISTARVSMKIPMTKMQISLKPMFNFTEKEEDR